MSVSAEHALQELKWSVQAMACDAEVQFTLFPDFTHKPDEVVLEFDNWYNATRWRDDVGMTPERLDALRKIDAHSESMAPERFQEDYMVDGDDWHQLRELAKSCIAVWGWILEPPPSNRAIYIQSK